MLAEQAIGEMILPPSPARVHFVGIGGIGMSGLARILNAWGYVVSGSDAAASPLLDELAVQGMAVSVGHVATDAAAVADLVIATAAVRADNLEIGAALAAGRPVIKRAQLLGALADARRGVAVAGSHGKSTTSGMLVTALRALGADPSSVDPADHLRLILAIHRCGAGKPLHAHRGGALLEEDRRFVIAVGNSWDRTYRSRGPGRRGKPMPIRVCPSRSDIEASTTICNEFEVRRWT